MQTKVKEFIEELRLLDPESSIDEYLEAKQRKYLSVLSFEEAGKAMRILIKIFGKKPALNTLQDQSGRRYKYRKVLWKNCHSEDITAAKALVESGVTDFKISEGGWFCLHIEKHIYVSSFYTSDNPEVWKQRQKSREDSYKVKYVVERLDRK